MDLPYAELDRTLVRATPRSVTAEAVTETLAAGALDGTTLLDRLGPDAGEVLWEMIGDGAVRVGVDCRISLPRPRHLESQGLSCESAGFAA